jgi:hypothetical protein
VHRLLGVADGELDVVIALSGRWSAVMAVPSFGTLGAGRAPPRAGLAALFV